MNLSEIITTLEAEDPTRVLPEGFNNPHSYRGDYMDLAFEAADNITIGDMLAAAQSAVGTTYQGWKGGDFTMAGWSWCWLSTEGEVSSETISPQMLRLFLTQTTLTTEQP